jgi:glycosyltransferase involved in cell wall biosynthesis
MNLPIAYVCADPGIPPDGSKGAAVHFRSLAAAFARQGASLDVFLARAGDTAGFRPHRARCVPVPKGSGRRGELLQLGHAETMLAALHSAGPHAAVYERLSLFGLAGLAHARELGVPFLVEVNAPLWREAASFRELGLPNAARGVCRDVLQQADRVLAVSRPLAQELQAEGVAAGRIEVLGNGADLAAFRGAAPAPKPPPLRGRPTLLFSGSLKPWHGVPFLLRAFAALRAQRPCGLWIVGDGPERAAIEVAMRAFPGDIVHEGAVAHERMPTLLQAADVVLAPYPAAAPDYFSPLKLVEALAAGRPILASRVPCVLDTLAGHVPAGLFEPDDIADFVATATKVLDLGPAAATEGIDPERIEALDWSHKAQRILSLLATRQQPPLQEAVRGR